MIDVLTSCETVVAHSTHVTLCESGLAKLTEHLSQQVAKNEAISSWEDFELFPSCSGNPSLAIDWIFLVDSLNFNFWHFDDRKKTRISYKGKAYTGYMALCAAVNRAIDEGIPILTVEYQKAVTLEQIEHIFRPDGDSERMPLLTERVSAMRELGECLSNHFESNASNMLLKANHSASKLLELIVKHLPMFGGDVIESFGTLGQPVAFYKRAQILIADIWSCFGGKDLGRFDDIDDAITMFADYRVPQVLNYFDAIRYSAEMVELLRNNHVFVSGDQMEVEIRAASIVAVDRLVKGLQAAASSGGVAKTNAITVDNYLWEFRRDNAAKLRHIPYHKIRCVFY